MTDSWPGGEENGCQLLVGMEGDASSGDQAVCQRGGGVRGEGGDVNADTQDWTGLVQWPPES